MEKTDTMAIAQRPLGQTGLTAPHLTLGGGYVGGVMIDPPEDVRRTALQNCLAAGVDWIDTATAYGHGQSETNIGHLLKDLPPAKRPRISTKYGLKPDDLTDPAGAVRRAIEASLDRLGLQKVEVFQLHNRIGRGGAGWITPYDLLRPGGIADAFAAVKAEGLADHIGLTALGDPQAVRDAIASGRFETAQVYYNALNQSAARNTPPGHDTTDFRGVLATCTAHGLGVFAIRILAAGALATTERHGREIPVTTNSDVDAEAARAAALWSAVGQPEGPTAEDAIRFAMTEPAISTAVFGAATLDHVAIALNAGAAGPLAEARATAMRRWFARMA